MQLGRQCAGNVEEVSELSEALGNVTIVRKGQHDVIALADKRECNLSIVLQLILTVDVANLVHVGV